MFSGNTNLSNGSLRCKEILIWNKSPVNSGCWSVKFQLWPCKKQLQLVVLDFYHEYNNWVALYFIFFWLLAQIFKNPVFVIWRIFCIHLPSCHGYICNLPTKSKCFNSLQSLKISSAEQSASLQTDMPLN